MKIEDEVRNIKRAYERSPKILHEIISSAKDMHNLMTGEDAFYLHNTYGLGITAIYLMAISHGLDIDLDTYLELKINQHKKSG